MNNQTSLIATLNFNAFADPALEAYNMLYVAVKKMLDKRGLQLYSGRTYKNPRRLSAPERLSGFLLPKISFMAVEESRITNKLPQSVDCKLRPPPSFVWHLLNKNHGGHHAVRTHRRHLWQTYATYSYKTLFYGGAL